MTDLTVRSSTLAPISNVNWDSSKEGFLTPLPLPTKDDDLATAAKKMRDLQAVVENGQSLALATHWKWAEDENRLEARWVAKHLSSQEFAQYVAWQEGVAPPSVDWNGSAWTSNDWANNVSKKHRHPSYKLIPALEILYPEKDIRAREAYCFNLDQCHARPLVSAVLKVERAGLFFLKDLALWITADKAEVVTVKRAVASGTRKLGKEPDLLDEDVQSIRTSIRIIQTRLFALHCKVLAYEEGLKSEGGACLTIPAAAVLCTLSASGSHYHCGPKTLWHKIPRQGPSPFPSLFSPLHA